MKRMSWIMAAAFALAACGSDTPPEPSTSAAPATSTEAAAPAVEPTGTVIEIDMITDEKGNYFEPSEITAKRGDVLRFSLVSGVHNVSFPADQASSGAGLPQAGAYLQLPGQTYDVTVAMEPGEYGFQCDPHAALGMIGTLEVVE